jgi:3-isopropylmalate/(R)-2-methylmalate dehydratase large subunit
MKKPKTMRITVNGKLNPYVSPKDVILYVISKIGAEGATEHFVEYQGDVFRNMSMEGRMTVCNMSIEMGARGGLVAVDDTTIDYLKSRINVTPEQESLWRTFVSDADATFDTEISFDAALIMPMITVGTSPDTGINIGEQIGTSGRLGPKALKYMQFDKGTVSTDQLIDYVFIGSCTNGRIEDLRAAAEVLKGRRIAGHVKAWIVPGSQQVKQQAVREGLDRIFTDAGCEFRDPGCSACLAMNNDKIPSGAVCVSTSNRNFEGRQGEGARTLLASPATAAASAIRGKITSAQQLVQAHEEQVL